MTIGTRGRLFTTITIEPYFEQVTDKKKKTTRFVKQTPLPSLNKYLTKNRSGSWAGAEFTRKEKQRLKKIVENHLTNNNLAAPKLVWAALDVVYFYPNYALRDLHNILLKDVIDVMTDCGFWEDDYRVIDVHILCGGVVANDSRVEINIYEMEVSKEEGKLLPSGKRRNSDKESNN